MILEFLDFTKKENIFENQRNQQSLEWMHSLIRESLINKFYKNSEVSKEIKIIEQKLLNGAARATGAAEELLNKFNK